jgi:hypothetical protein
MSCRAIGPGIYVGDIRRQNMTLTTMNGENISITTKSDSTTFVNNAQVITPNLLVANGVVHGIDKYVVPGFSGIDTLLISSHSVLNPNNISAGPDSSASTPQAALSGTTTISGGAVPSTGAVSLPTAFK